MVILSFLDKHHDIVGDFFQAIFIYYSPDKHIKGKLSLYSIYYYKIICEIRQRPMAIEFDNIIFSFWIFPTWYEVRNPY